MMLVAFVLLFYLFYYNKVNKFAGSVARALLSALTRGRRAEALRRDLARSLPRGKAPPPPGGTVTSTGNLRRSIAITGTIELSGGPFDGETFDDVPAGARQIFREHTAAGTWHEYERKGTTQVFAHVREFVGKPPRPTSPPARPTRPRPPSNNPGTR